MGIYLIPCVKCGKHFQWFSGNLDQRCPECKDNEQYRQAMEEQVRATQFLKDHPPEAIPILTADDVRRIVREELERRFPLTGHSMTTKDSRPGSSEGSWDCQRCGQVNASWATECSRCNLLSGAKNTSHKALANEAEYNQRAAGLTDEQLAIIDNLHDRGKAWRQAVKERDEQIAQLTARVKELETTEGLLRHGVHTLELQLMTMTAERDALQEQLSVMESAWHTDVERQKKYRVALERINGCELGIDDGVSAAQAVRMLIGIAREALAP